MPIAHITGHKNLFFPGLVWSMTVRQSALTTRALMDSNAHWWSAVQEKCVLLVSGVNMYVWSASLGRNDAMYQTWPKKAHTLVELVGTGQSKNFWIFDMFNLIPWAEMWCPRKSISIRKKSHFLGLQNNHTAISAFMTITMCFICSATVLDQTTMSLI